MRRLSNRGSWQCRNASHQACALAASMASPPMPSRAERTAGGAPESRTQALPCHQAPPEIGRPRADQRLKDSTAAAAVNSSRSEEHTSELQSLTNLVCRLLLEKKKRKNN